MHKLRNITIAVLLFAPLFAGAQAVSDPVQYIIAPETPGPNALVVIEAQGVGPFLGNANIRWTQDGKTVLEGVGERKFSFTTGALGSSSRIRINITSATAGSFSKELVFTPSLVNLVWEADTTTPPFYRGKALYSAGSPLKVVAFPSVFSGGSQISPSSLSYQWSRNSELLPAQSGLGRSTLTLDGDQLQTQESVVVDINYGNARVARGELVVPAVEPRIMLYSRDALHGTRWEAALPARIQLNVPELTVQAEPFYFSMTSKKNNQLAFVWTLNGEDASGPDSSKGILTLRQSGGGVGSASLGVSLQNNDTNAFIQQAAAAIEIVFGTQNSSVLNFFGL
ncbi:hypothetical protein EXS62_01080 [Candidatus Kaiserbacteria bacterium]|nr:hypothetical protein [Candidatus Kaiserbacteria bacterium]